MILRKLTLVLFLLGCAVGCSDNSKPIGPTGGGGGVPGKSPEPPKTPPKTNVPSP